jgi:hypothetical protein
MTPEKGNKILYILKEFNASVRRKALGRKERHLGDREVFRGLEMKK